MARRELHIGLTYDLREDYRDTGLDVEDLAEFDRPDTIEAIEEALLRLGHRPERIGGLRALLPRLHGGDRWDLVFNIAEGLNGVGREAQVPALLDAFDIAYTFSDPLVSALTLHKGMTKRVLRDLGLPTAPFATIDDVGAVPALALRYPLFAKPVAEGTSKGIDARALVHDAGALAEVCRRLLARFRQPVLVEEYLPGREFTVGVVGTGCAAMSVGVLEAKLRAGADPGACTFRNKEECESLVDYTVVTDADAGEAERLALAAWRGLGCRDGGRVDLRADGEGRLQILELNPLAGLHPSHSDLPILWGQTGRDYDALIDAIVRSAASRIAGERVAPCPS